MVKKRSLTRRAFLGFAATVGILPFFSCPRRRTAKGIIVFRRSLRGRHGSNAAKRHAANHVYKTSLAAILDKAHPGDNGKVVEITISQAFYDRIFRFGGTSADLRQVL
jgi:hypothetical protein